MRFCATTDWLLAKATLLGEPNRAELHMRKKRIAKSNLPEKLCVICLRPMQWRKKWEKVWDEVKYCSDACRKGTPR